MLYHQIFHANTATALQVPPHQGQLAQATGKSNEKPRKQKGKKNVYEKALSSDFIPGAKEEVVVVLCLFFLI
jgi:hypothetical protein